MGERKVVGNFLLTLLILLIVFLGLVLLVFRTSGKVFIGEIVIFLFFVFLGFISSFGIYFGSRWGFSLLAFMYALVLFDLLALYYFTRQIDKVYFFTVVLSAIGFIASVSSIKQREEAREAKKKPSIEVYHEPGKFAASKTASFYHAPKCDWAKKIKKENLVWYNSDAEAEKAGLKKHSCLG